ncbi:MAG TPA: hypothetical protein VEI74_09040 [Candidatus Methylomirabilis sp.]|nr:hypothetical protein [Candidatus Methylomirabilis sp.]
MELLHAHQLEFPVADFLKRLQRRVSVIVHAHVTAVRFNEARGVAARTRQAGYGKNLPLQRTEVLPNGVDTALFAPVRVQDAGCSGLQKGLSVGKSRRRNAFPGSSIAQRCAGLSAKQHC